jgi:hypothetical protein
MRIELRQHFDDDLLPLRAQHRIDGRQMCIEPNIHDAAAHRDDHAEVRCVGCVFHTFSR